MSLIKLSDGCWIAAEEVAEVSIKPHGGVSVRMKNGIGHNLGNDYGCSEYSTLNRVVREINAAIQAEKEAS